MVLTVPGRQLGNGDGDELCACTRGATSASANASASESSRESRCESERRGDIRGGLLQIGRSVGMTDDQTLACIQDEKQLKALNDRVEKAMTVEKINATPTFIVAGKKLEGEQTMATFDSVIQPLLAAK